MKKNIKIIYLIEFIIFIFIIFLKMNIKQIDINITLLSFFGLMCLVCLLIFRFPRDKSYYRSGTIRLVVISLLSYLIIIYGLGLIIGFVRTPFIHSPITIIKNVLPVICLIIFKEIIRYLICKNSPNNKKPVIIITILFVILSIISESYLANLGSLESIFIFTSVTVLPIIFKEMLYSYLTYNVSIMPTLLIRIPFEIFIYITPFYPNFDNYLSAVIGIFYPFIVYYTVNNRLMYAEKKDKILKKTYRNFITYPIYFILIVLIVLISGILKYQLIAIGSNSMKDVYERGDAVLVEKYNKNNINNINIGDILVYEHNNLIITHRVVDKYYVNGHVNFRTKGDNNEAIDSNTIKEEDVKGIVINRIKYIGYPTIIIKDIFQKE